MNIMMRESRENRIIISCQSHTATLKVSPGNQDVRTGLAICSRLYLDQRTTQHQSGVTIKQLSLEYTTRKHKFSVSFVGFHSSW